MPYATNSGYEHSRRSSGLIDKHKEQAFYLERAIARLAHVCVTGESEVRAV